jgi:hypothetical protein
MKATRPSTKNRPTVEFIIAKNIIIMMLKQKTEAEKLLGEQVTST